MRTSRTVTAAVIAFAVIPAAACSKTASSSSYSIPPVAKASISALASVPGADAQAILIRAGVPVHGTSAQQIAFARSMLVKTNRQALAVKLEIPPQNRTAFAAALLDKAKADHVLTSHAGRVQFVDVDLGALLVRYQA